MDIVLGWWPPPLSLCCLQPHSADWYQEEICSLLNSSLLFIRVSGLRWEILTPSSEFLLLYHKKALVLSYSTPLQVSKGQLRTIDFRMRDPVRILIETFWKLIPMKKTEFLYWLFVGGKRPPFPHAISQSVWWRLGRQKNFVANINFVEHICKWLLQQEIQL